VTSGWSRPEEQVPVAERERALVPLAAGGAGLTPADLVGRAARLALGAAGLALAALEALLERSGSADPAVRAGAGGTAAPSRPPGTLPLLSHAALGFGLEAQRRSLDAAAALGARLSPPLRVVARPAVAVARVPLVAVWRRLDVDGWAARGLAEQRRNRQDAAVTARELVTVIAAAVLEQVDLNAVVARVDLDRIVEHLDLDAIVDRLDLDRIAGRIDIDAIAARIDLNAVVARIDLAGLTEQVMDEVDIGELIRESSGTMATETVDALRVQGMRADGLLSRVVDRIMQRKGERRTDPVAAARQREVGDR
jgi:hypothetical protein